LKETLAKAPDQGESIIIELSESRSAAVRAWSSWAGKELLGSRAVPLLERLARDRNEEVSEIAFTDLKSVDHVAAGRFLPTVRQRLRGPGAVGALWNLAEYRDVDALPDIQAVAADDTRPQYVRALAEIVAAVLDGETGSIATRIRRHDHDLMHWLAPAATMLGGQELMDALAACASSAPDANCRERCGSALDVIRRPPIVL
jgi:hypothetical protein